MLRSLGYARAYSVQGGFQAWKAGKAQAEAQAQGDAQPDQNRK